MNGQGFARRCTVAPTGLQSLPAETRRDDQRSLAGHRTGGATQARKCSQDADRILVDVVQLVRALPVKAEVSIPHGSRLSGQVTRGSTVANRANRVSSSDSAPFLLPGVLSPIRKLLIHKHQDARGLLRSRD
jgi:hypothetical protein